MPHTLILNADASPLNPLYLKAENWKEAIKQVWEDSVEVLHEYDQEVRSPSISLRIPSVVMLKEYQKPNFSVKFTRWNLLLRDNFTCQFCGVDHLEDWRQKLTADHVLPRSKGGKTNWTNLSLACIPCNTRKGNNEKIVPKVMPYEPTYFQLLKNVRRTRIRIPSETWLDYIDRDRALIDIVPPEFNFNEIADLSMFKTE